MARVDFYRECDIVAEGVVPPQTGAIVSSDAYEASAKNVAEVLGQNQLLEGISVRTPGWLVNFFQKSRTVVTAGAERAAHQIETVSRRYYEKERRITSTVAALHSNPREELLPGFGAVAVAYFSGSVLTRKRGIVLRVCAPLALGLGAFSYFLPTTFRNTKSLCYDLEKRAFPQFVAQQDRLAAGTKRAVCGTVHTTVSAYNATHRACRKVTKVFRDWTGLNL
ncbi:ADL146Wp [Eremothecium gossypii ATCC 10895]|uniref:MICOS complex subunit n=1 Tax=Eremothecium gossypii (strain ATCC 10895 / CBS 109.51 / FGSC 9923 / NRRL Y-1056) TaxID=284811 RepID=Q75AR6_EREGS|nr:ADL146Wp [Eremothecium gossypii ATCC 10895]AAS51774.1 ADL146Wp [Eremothecium gossypii ATCC 10895]AEY96072.1 FADL146Wp [Eremothecium gossypii FDAG1]